MFTGIYFFQSCCVAVSERSFTTTSSSAVFGVFLCFHCLMFDYLQNTRTSLITQKNAAHFSPPPHVLVFEFMWVFSSALEALTSDFDSSKMFWINEQALFDERFGSNGLWHRWFLEKNRQSEEQLESSGTTLGLMTSMWGKGQGELLGNTRHMKYPRRILLSVNMCILMTSTLVTAKQKQLSFCENHISHVTALQVWIHNNHFKFTIQPQIHWMHKSHMQLQKHSSSNRTTWGTKRFQWKHKLDN